MASTTAPTRMPALGTGLYADGKRAALRAISEDYMTLDGDALAALAQVTEGNAPQEFKNGFCETFTALCAVLEVKS